MADVRVDVQVLDSADGHPVQGLAAIDFVVNDEDQPQKIEYCAETNERASIVLLMDVSGSMQKFVETLTRNAREALGVLTPGDRVAIMVFAKTQALHRDFSDNLAETVRQIPLAITSHDIGYSTNINAAILSAAKVVEKHADVLNGHSISGRHAILIITDNLGLNYLIPDETVIRELYNADATLNAIVVGRAIRPAPPKPGQYVNPDFTPADVYHLAEETGGEVIRADISEEAFRDMIARIRLRYTLAYHAPEAQPGSFRHIHVDLTPDARRRYPSAVIHARTGYYASAA